MTEEPVAMPANWFAGMPEEYRKEAWRAATSPAAQRPWVNLTVDELIDLERKHLSHENLTRAIEAKLKEKNA
jgi:hypothetical protein